MTDDYQDATADGTDDLHELVESAPVTRAATTAQAFMEHFFEKFAEAELADDKKFLLEASDFDSWMIEHGLMPAEINGSDQLALRGMTSVRNDVRKTINSAATFGKNVWPPFSIEVYEQGRIYEVRLLEYFLDKLPGETTASVMRYLSNKYKYWGQLCDYADSEPVQKVLRGKPETAARLQGAKSAIRLTFKNAALQLQNCHEEVMATYREARALIADTRTKDDEDEAA